MTTPLPFIRVLLPLPFDEGFDYLIPDGVPLEKGDYVRVPFGNRTLVGVVWEIPTSQSPHPKSKKILERLPFPPLPQINREFIEWVAGYTLTKLGLILKMVISVREAFDPPKKRERVKDFQKPNLVPVDLSPPQRKAVETIRHNLKSSPKPPPFLLDGVTGSGKTEVYFELIQDTLNQGRQCLVLLPEISLSSQWLTRFEERFGTSPVVWHSSLTKAQRRQNWRAITKGEAKVIVGARSALFLPFKNLGLIVVDEEHDSSYKQEELVIYNARDMAVVRGSLAKIPVILASATPSLESLENARTGKYQALHLPSRFGASQLPEIILIDMRAYSEKQRGVPLSSKWISPPLLQALKTTIEAKEQGLLFLNRRGYAPLSLCQSCGERISCPYCTAWLVDHRRANHLTCHHCGHTIQPIRQCPSCGEEKSVVPCGPGVERIAEELSKCLPACRFEVVTSDTVQSPKALQEILSAFQNQHLDVLIGTQMLAKGFHFPRLTLVGVIDGDLGLAGSDLRASEKTFQLLHQVAGRAGRADHPGRVYLQTYQPENPLFQSLISHDRNQYLEQEKLGREMSGMPPFGRLAALILSSANQTHLDQTLRTLSAKIPRLEDVEFWGPAPAPLSMLRGKHRWRYLVKTPRGVNIQAVVKDWLQGLELPSTVKLQIDIDPVSFL